MVTECSDVVFELAPVMMHAINQDGELVKVNRRWLTTLGYERDEVLGQKSLDFLTDESRLVAVQDTLPLFWQAGSAHSIGYRFLRKNGRVLNVLMDAEAVRRDKGELSTLATLRAPDSATQRQQGSTTMHDLQILYQDRHQLDNLLSTRGPEFRTQDTVAVEPLEDGGRFELATVTVPDLMERPLGVLEAGSVMSKPQPGFPQPGIVEEPLNVLVEASRDVAANLRTLVGVHEDWREAILEQQNELLLVTKSIDKTLAQFADTISAQD